MRSRIHSVEIALAALAAVGLWACGGGERGETSGRSMGQGSSSAAEFDEAIEGSERVNRPPEIRQLSLRPAEPNPGDRLTANLEVIDADGDSFDIRYEWRVDGEPSEVTGETFMVPSVAKGARITLRVSVEDSAGASSWADASVALGNLPPRILGAALKPEGPITRGAPLEVRPRGFDPDGDELEFSYEWQVNGFTRGGDSNVLQPEYFEVGDSISFRIVASDGWHSSEPLESDPLVVQNAIPRIESRPAGVGADGVFRYQISAVDPDGDPRLRYRLLRGPEGMSVDESTGEVVWVPTAEAAGAVDVELEVKDFDGGVTTQSFSFQLSFGATPAAPEPQ